LPATKSDGGRLLLLVHDLDDYQGEVIARNLPSDLRMMKGKRHVT